jgi:outer membrane protein insertion porin family
MIASIRISMIMRLFFLLPLSLLVLQTNTVATATKAIPSQQKKAVQTPTNNVAPATTELSQQEQSAQEQASPESTSSEQDIPEKISTKNVTRRIKSIDVSGNVFVAEQAILNRIPFIVGEVFNPLKTSTLIRNLYSSLGKFRNITVLTEAVGDDQVIVHIVVEEKRPLKEFVVEGNKHVPIKDIRTKLQIDELSAIDEEELRRFASGIKKLYFEKGFHEVDVQAELIIDKDDHATAKFIVNEHKKSLVKRVFFSGNKHIASNSLRSIIFTREDWVLSFLDKAGTFHPERIEGDKYFIEQYYQNHGFINAKVYNVKTDLNEKTKEMAVTFEIEEGDRYTINEVNVRGNDILSDDYLQQYVGLKPSMYYSKEAIVNTIKRLENVWGNKGYIFAHIEPSIQPDEENKTVSVGFYSDPGLAVTLNKITVRGNNKTRDKIIRRRILLNEGDLLSNDAMEASKNRIEALGYFDQKDGVTWKTTRLDNNRANLDLVLKEAKTGHFDLRAGFGGSPTNMQSAASGFTFGGSLSDTNLGGSGLTVKIDSSWSKDEITGNLHIADPWLFDKNIFGAFDLYHRRPNYDEFRHMRPVKEKLTGSSLTTGFMQSLPVLEEVQFLTGIGIDNVRRDGDLVFKWDNTSPTTEAERLAYETIMNREFAKGTFTWLSGRMESDTRNHPMHPSRGHKWQLFSRFAFNTLNDKISFYKLGLETSWFTPLIGEYDLVFKLHTYAGITSNFKNKCIPFSELYHVGGPATIRGFLFGQIGPKVLGDSIGAKKAAFVNAELIFPITQDFNMTGVLFYDGGSGWDAPFSRGLSPEMLRSNNFDYRHSVGFGIRILNPMPIKVDWGFKLDPRKNRLNPQLDESAYEVHFGMAYDW